MEGGAWIIYKESRNEKCMFWEYIKFYRVAWQPKQDIDIDKIEIVKRKAATNGSSDKIKQTTKKLDKWIEKIKPWVI